MIRILLPMILVLIPATALADVGDLTPIAEEPGQMLVAGIFGGGQEFTPASKTAGLVHPKAEVVEIEFYQRPDLKVTAAFDAADPGSDDPWQLVRIDCSGKGDFSGCPAFALRKEMGRVRVSYTFGPTLFEADIDGRKMDVVVSGYGPLNDPEERYFSLTLGKAVEGECLIGGKIRKVRVFDGDYNLMIRAMPPEFFEDRKVFYRFHRDAVLIDTGTGDFSLPLKGYLAQPIWIEDGFYAINVSEDETKVFAKKLRIEPGWIKANVDSWQGWFYGGEHVMFLAGGKEPIPVPPDTYHRVYYDVEHRGGGLFARWLKEAPGSMKVSAGVTGVWNLGTPLTMRTVGTVSGRTVTFRVEMKDETGLNVEGITGVDGKQAAPPEMEVFDAAGRSVFRSRFERG